MQPTTVTATVSNPAPVVVSAPLPTGNPVVTLSPGSTQPLAPGCNEVHLDGGSGLTVDKLLAKTSPAANVQTVSVQGANGYQFVYINPGTGAAPPATYIGSGQLVLQVCIVGTGTTITA
jgi:hypothetical protein